MGQRSFIPRLGGILTSVFGLLAGGNAASQPPAPEVTVAVFADRYVVAGRSIDDLDVLEKTVGAMQARAVRLDACGEGTALAQRAAAHRFRDRYLELRVLDAKNSFCRSAAAARAVPKGIDDNAVDRWWYAMVP